MRVIVHALPCGLPAAACAWTNSHGAAPVEEPVTRAVWVLQGPSAASLRLIFYVFALLNSAASLNLARGARLPPEGRFGGRHGEPLRRLVRDVGWSGHRIILIRLKRLDPNATVTE